MCNYFIVYLNNNTAIAEEEVERLRAANDKLRYRLNILKVATAREEQLLQGTTGGAGQPGQPGLVTVITPA